MVIWYVVVLRLMLLMTSLHEYVKLKGLAVRSASSVTTPWHISQRTGVNASRIFVFSLVSTTSLAVTFSLRLCVLAQENDPPE